MSKARITQQQLAYLVDHAKMPAKEAAKLTKTEATGMITTLMAKHATAKLIEWGEMTPEQVGKLLPHEVIAEYRLRKKLRTPNEVNALLRTFKVGEQVLYNDKVCTITALWQATLHKYHDFNVTVKKPDGHRQVVSVKSIRKLSEEITVPHSTS